MRYYLFPILIVFFGLSLPLEGYGGIIKTRVVSHYKVEKSGKIDMAVNVLNTGNATAYNVVVTIFLADWVHISDDLGRNPPGGSIQLSAQSPKLAWKPGRYTGVIRIRFKEQSGRYHKAYHFFEIPYNMDQVADYDSHLDLQIKSPLFNTKGFWQPKGKISFSMKNGFPKAVRPTVAIYLPDGFSSYESNWISQLSTGEEIMKTIPLSMDQSVTRNSTYNVVVWYEYNGIHYSKRIQDHIQVENRPIYFRWYIIFVAMSSVILLGIILYRHRMPRSLIED